MYGLIRCPCSDVPVQMMSINLVGASVPIVYAENWRDIRIVRSLCNGAVESSRVDVSRSQKCEVLFVSFVVFYYVSPYFDLFEFCVGCGVDSGFR
jgi:hypothetical protein